MQNKTDKLTDQITYLSLIWDRIGSKTGSDNWKSQNNHIKSWVHGPVGPKGPLGPKHGDFPTKMDPGKNVLTPRCSVWPFFVFLSDPIVPIDRIDRLLIENLWCLSMCYRTCTIIAYYLPLFNVPRGFCRTLTASTSPLLELQTYLPRPSLDQCGFYPIRQFQNLILELMLLWRITNNITTYKTKLIN